MSRNSTKKPSRNPVYTCDGLCALSFRRAKPTNPAIIIEIIEINSKSMLSLKEMPIMAAIMPPIPTAWALIFHLVVINKTKTIETAAPNTSVLNMLGKSVTV